MNSRLASLITLLIASAFILSACNMPGLSTPTITPDNAATLSVKATQTSLARPTATETPFPSATATETPTPTETATQEPSATPTIAIPIADVFKESNCRTGPAGNYDLVTVIAPGTKVEVIAQDQGAGYYWFVRNPENAEQGCWVLTQNAKVDGDTSILPVYTPRASPTPAPSFQVAFKNFDQCNGDVFVRFSVTNTGGVPFRSAYVKVTDAKTGESEEQVLNAFDLSVGCIIAKNVAPLNAGQSGHLQSPEFKKDPRDHRLNAVIMICTEQNLNGTCVTQTLEIKP